MNDQRLRLDLADLAEEVTLVDVRDRVLRTSRRLGIRRAVAGSAAAVALLGAATGTAFAFSPKGSPGPTPGNLPSVVTSPSPADPWANVGRIFYLPTVSDMGNIPLTAWRPGGQPSTLVDLPGSVLGSNAAVSSDGRQVAWVQDTELMLADVDGPNRRVVSAHVEAGSCWGPSWSPDSQSLAAAVMRRPGIPIAQYGLVDLKTGRFAPLKISVNGCRPVWSADGQLLAYTDGEGRVAVTNRHSSATRVVPRLGGNNVYDSYHVVSLSRDGSRVALLRTGPTEDDGDIARDLNANAVVDTRTGATVNLPLGGRKLIQAYFLPDDRLVARVKGGGGNQHLLLIDADGHLVTEVAEPAALANQQILAVTSS
ncbi:hypothetical protein [Micromonospora sp. KC723]|uniref:hypothetical protein n=1 Tax=Micromonospora sp. KC723 TaxID=2530381 RepID=UPI00104FA2E1|nr:hypothetical protein [Micromonospora sp. KC723]TDB75669.1 hypothetical protein E1165_10055 [Micromonospora sp. KC723]